MHGLEMFLSILMQEEKKKQVILVHLRVCETDWNDIHQNVDSDCLWVVEQLIGEFVFLCVSQNFLQQTWNF